jgi:hypothetical protein
MKQVHVTSLILKFLKKFDLERQLEDISKKCRCQKQKYEEAAKLRDDENASKRISYAQEQWEEDAKKPN